MSASRAAQIWNYRFFLRSLVQREFKLRYTQSLLGTGWLVIEPLILVITLSTIFTLLGRGGPGGAPFPIFFYSGLLPWQIFAGSLTAGARCFLSDQGLMQKVAYPKEISVIKLLTIFLIDFLFASISFVAVMAFYQYSPNIYYLYIPPLLLAIVLLGAGMMFLTATVQVYIRDVGILMKSLSQVWFWFTPIIFYYPFDGPTKILFYINPMAGLINSFREIILFGRPPIVEQLYCSAVWILCLMFLGYRLFRKYEKEFVDVI